MSLWVCPTHGLHHGPFCCCEPQSFWDGTFASVGRSAERQDPQGLDPKDEHAVPRADEADAQPPLATIKGLNNV